MKLTDFPNLSAHLKGDKRARVELHLAGPYKPFSARERVVANPHIEKFAKLTFGTSGAEADIIVGVCRAEQSSGNGLSAARVFALMASAPKLSTAYIANAFGLDDRQARRYMAACKLAILLLARHFVKQEEVTVPRTRALTLAEIRAAHQRGNPCPK
jgi:hypothetical protein